MTAQQPHGLTESQLKQIHLVILRELGLTGFPPTMQESIIAEVGQNIFMAIQAESLRMLPEVDQNRYIELIDANKPEEATKLLEKHIKNLDEFVANVASDTVKDFKASMEAMK